MHYTGMNSFLTCKTEIPKIGRDNWQGQEEERETWDSWTPVFIYSLPFKGIYSAFPIKFRWFMAKSESSVYKRTSNILSFQH
jgi:hypothetical protein